MEDKPFTQYYKEEREEKVATRTLYRLLFVILFIFIILFSVSVAFNQKYTYITISGQSMQSTLNPSPVLTNITTDGKTTKSWVQDGVYVEKTKNVTYDDVIIVENLSSEKTVIKRLLGMEGDYISIALVQVQPSVYEYRLLRVKAHSSYVEVLNEEYVKSYYEWTAEGDYESDAQTPNIYYEPYFYQTFSLGDYESKLITVNQAGGEVKFFKIPENEIFYMGDNRPHSADSRQKGTTNINNVLGKVVEIVRDGTYYKGNEFYFFNRLKGCFSVIWDEILRFFGANI
ncbi:MAG: signal peptidase I [Clostridia bacterium]|nr:signal peptidase I [Clostridia bacterium]